MSKQSRRETARGLLMARRKRTDQEQLWALDVRLGRGVGAKRERERLKKRMAEKRP